VKIGKGTCIFQNVTLGDKKLGASEFPTIGKNVIIYAGAVIVGNITIGDNCSIASNAVVINNLPDNCIVGGIPARILKRNLKK